MATNDPTLHHKRRRLPTRLAIHLVLVAGLTSDGWALEKCAARYGRKDGVLRLSAAAVTGQLRIAMTPTSEPETIDPARCTVSGDMTQCSVSDPGQLPPPAPPADCTARLSDDSDSCLAYVRGCVPGERQVNPCLLVTNGGKDIVYQGCNVHVRNTSGLTTVSDGNGNLIIGWDAASLPALERTGSHNLIIGDDHSWTSTGGVVAGHANTISGRSASVLSGTKNGAAGEYSAVLGGSNNDSTGVGATISGGTFGLASGGYSTVCGGSSGFAAGFRSTVSGGGDNAATALDSFAGGGGSNLADGAYSTSIGGTGNTASGNSSATIGGEMNVAQGGLSLAAGGSLNTAGVFGSLSSTTIGGSFNTALETGATVLGGFDNLASGTDSTVTGGYANLASGPGSVVTGGESNAAEGQTSTVSGGQNRTAKNTSNWVAGSLFEAD